MPFRHHEFALPTFRPSDECEQTCLTYYRLTLGYKMTRYDKFQLREKQNCMGSSPDAHGSAEKIVKHGAFCVLLKGRHEKAHI